eukprot:c10044_g1_i2.p1 GENE.c10044_g1_i2~~c10044_g1_i2.p1  ORF type:complete len:477 (-),score=129.52 c10044_g1_i2:142-1572(-)
MTTLVAVLTLASSLSIVLVTSVDVATVESFFDQSTGTVISLDIIEEREHEIRTLYFVLMGITLGCSFVLIPFCYFFFQADYDHINFSEKIANGLKHTFLFMIIAGVLLSLGMVLTVDPDSVAEAWLHRITKEQSPFESGISFAIACLSSVGMFAWCSYAAYGMIHVPLDMTVSVIPPDREEEEVVADLSTIREQIRSLQSRYTMTGRKMTRKDKKDLEDLQQQLQLLERRNRRIQQRHSMVSQLCDRLHPFVQGCGVLWILVVLLMLAAFGTTSVDRAMNSSCQERCGWALTQRTIWNPLDELLLACNENDLHPISGGIVFLMVAVVVVCTTGALVRLGLRFVWVKLHQLHRQASSPQALLMAVFYLIFVLMALFSLLLGIAPQYFTFGAQRTVVDGEKRACTLDDMSRESSTCRMTQISIILNQQLATLPFFGVCFFVGLFVFFATFFLFALIKSIKGRQRFDDEDPAEEHQGLL